MNLGCGKSRKKEVEPTIKNKADKREAKSKVYNVKKIERKK